jgi:hypothetical protein
MNSFYLSSRYQGRYKKKLEIQHRSLLGLLLRTIFELLGSLQRLKVFATTWTLDLQCNLLSGFGLSSEVLDNKEYETK